MERKRIPSKRNFDSSSEREKRKQFQTNETTLLNTALEIPLEFFCQGRIS